MSKLQEVTMTVRIRIIRPTVHIKKWDSSTHKYFIHQTAKILTPII